jgi:hypothetical protein
MFVGFRRLKGAIRNLFNSMIFRDSVVTGKSLRETQSIQTDHGYEIRCCGYVNNDGRYKVRRLDEVPAYCTVQYKKA